MTTESKELVAVPPTETALAVFTAKEGLDPWLKQVRAEIDKFNQTLPELKTNKGREMYASMAYKIAKSKTALDAVGKKLSAEQKEVPKLIDAERKRVWDKLELWQKEVRKPLDDWQAAEDARVDRHNERLNWLKTLTNDLAEANSLLISGLIAEAEGMEIGGHWEEFEAEAARLKDSVLTKLRAALATRQQSEAEQAELVRLRAESEAQAQRDRDAQIAREAEDRAKAEAERAALAERDAVAQREKEAKAVAEKRELELKLQAEKAERQAAQAKADQLATEQKAEQDRIAAVNRQAAAVEQARLDELARQKAAADEVIRQQQLREADTKHKGKIMRAAKESIMELNVSEELAKAIVLKIARGEVPNIVINF